MFFSLGAASEKVQVLSVDLSPLLSLTEKFNLLEESAKSLSKELDEFKYTNLGIELTLKYKLYFKLIEELFKNQKDLLDKKSVEESDCKFEELKKSLNSLEFLIDCWKMVTLKLQILEIYLYSQDKELGKKDLLNIKLNIFNYLFSNLLDVQEQSKNKYVANIVRKFVPKRIYSTWFKYNDIAYKLFELNIEKEKDCFETYKKVLLAFKNQSLEDLNSLWIELEIKMKEMRVYLFERRYDLKDFEKRNLESILTVFESLQIQIVKALTQESDVSSKDGKKKEADIKIRFEGVDSELVSKVIKKLLVELGPLNLTKIILSGAWERLISLFVFSS